MASSRLRAKLRGKVWKLLREVGGSDIEIQRDPLHARYQVNRHGIRVVGPKAVLDDTFDRVLALMVVHGWTVTPGQHVAVARHGNDPCDVRIECPYDHPGTAILPKREVEFDAYMLVHF